MMATVDTAPGCVGSSMDLADLNLGRAIREMVASKSDADTARRFCDALIVPTRPGNTERATQDRAYEMLASRLIKAGAVSE